MLTAVRKYGHELLVLIKCLVACSDFVVSWVKRVGSEASVGSDFEMPPLNIASNVDEDECED
jgi:hypothetical protein